MTKKPSTPATRALTMDILQTLARLEARMAMLDAASGEDVVKVLSILSNAVAQLDVVFEIEAATNAYREWQASVLILEVGAQKITDAVKLSSTAATALDMTEPFARITDQVKRIEQRLAAERAKMDCK
jgi:hypothetical protein